MHLIGIPLRKPTTTQVTSAAVLGTGLWMGLLGGLRALGVDLARDEAVALLLVCAWGSLSAPLGIHLERGVRHVMANAAVSGLLVGLWQVASGLMG